MNNHGTESRISFRSFIITLLSVLLLGGCATAYYDAMERAGIHKRDILIDRIKDVGDSQITAQKEFRSALEQFASVIHLEDTDLKRMYGKLNAEYEDCRKAARAVSSRIDQVESVADALFHEWKEELRQYTRSDLRETSRQRMEETRVRYREMLAGMHRAEKSMEPVLAIFSDNVLFLKHNLNAQAIASLKVEFSTLRGQIDGLVKRMNESIAVSEKFIAEMKQ